MESAAEERLGRGESDSEGSRGRLRGVGGRRGIAEAARLGASGGGRGSPESADDSTARWTTYQPAASAVPAATRSEAVQSGWVGAVVDARG
jgi:hypothetical protein